MGTFFRSRHGLAYERGFVQGSGRILIANYNAGASYPDGIEDIVSLAPGATQYDIVAPFNEVGFTKTGVNITRNNAEEDFDVDQLTASIRRRPNNWEMSVGTQLAEASLETFQTAWELGPISTLTKGTALPAPVAATATTATTGGTLPATTTYFYVVTALNASGETIKSNEKTVTTGAGATNSNTVTWATVAGATGYKIYRGTSAGGENVYYSVGAVLTFTDTGAASTVGTPPLVNTTAAQFDERHIGLGTPVSYAEKMVAVLFQFPDLTIRAWVFRRCVRAAQESGLTLQKTGEQISLPMRWNAMAVDGVGTDTAFGEMFEQIPA
jgi:hypothetical protein